VGTRSRRDGIIGQIERDRMASIRDQRSGREWLAQKPWRRNAMMMPSLPVANHDVVAAPLYNGVTGQ
jgi:hypothetical protein